MPRFPISSGLPFIAWDKHAARWCVTVPIDGRRVRKSGFLTRRQAVIAFNALEPLHGKGTYPLPADDLETLDRFVADHRADKETVFAAFHAAFAPVYQKATGVAITRPLLSRLLRDRCGLELRKRGGRLHVVGIDLEGECN